MWASIPLAQAQGQLHELQGPMQSENVELCFYEKQSKLPLKV